MCSRGTLNDLPDGRPAEPSAATRPVARLPLLSRLFLSVREFVEFSIEELIKKAIDALDHEIDIPKLTYTMQTAGNAFAAGTHESHSVDEHCTDTGLKYDLIGKVAEGTVLTRKTVRAILAGMQKCRFDQFRNNSEKFIAEVVRIINEQKGAMVVEHI